MQITEEKISNLIFENLNNHKDLLIKQYNQSKANIGYFYIDNLLPAEIALECFKVFPVKTEMKCLKSIKEFKFVSAQMDKHNKLLEKVIFAFQSPKIVNLIGEICDIKKLYADNSLYAGGLSLMADKNYLNPHLDNSHDANRNNWRVLNLLFYVTPDWKNKNGGHLEVWPNGPKQTQIVIESKFNRLVVMATHQNSWHSVSKVNSLESSRCCISNYYFSPNPLIKSDKFHITKFKARPNETFKNIVLDIDTSVRMLIRKFFKKGIRKNPHIYKKEKDN